MTHASDVVVVGGGIGGASFAFALARDGVGVTVLEASDGVRGPRARREHAGLGREGGTRTRCGSSAARCRRAHHPGVEAVHGRHGDAGDIPMAMMVPDIPGSLNLRHPDACQALLDAAAAAGATVVRGVRDVVLADGRSPTVSYAMNGQTTSC